MAEHTGEHLKGQIKEAVGDMTEDKGLKREGKVDQASADAKTAVGRVADKVKDVANPERRD